MKWEYKTIEMFEGVYVLTLLNEYGEQGWEFVWCDIDKNVFIFKRPKDIAIRELSNNDEAGIRKAIEGYFGGKVG